MVGPRDDEPSLFSEQPAPGEMEAMRQMLIQQQKELMELKAAK